MQAQTVARRFDEASAIWLELDRLIEDNPLPERVTDILYEAILGYRLRRCAYLKTTGVERRTASRDLGRLVDTGIRKPRGETRGRHYVAGGQLRELRQRCRDSRPSIRDPYPELPATLRTQAAGSAGPRG